MRKITPIMLVLLMVASLMANIDITQLETNEEIEETGARNGADAELIAITSPKETQCSPDCRNELLVGQATTFEVFIQNTGSQDISELGYKAQVWISDGDGIQSMPASDANGNLLLWDNPDVICDDTSVCNDQTLAAGAVFKGGKTTLQYLGSDAVWTPEAGVYVVQIETYSDEDVDPGNDVQQVYVEVVDYVDISVDIAWDSGNVVATGNGPHGFTVTVNLGGSTDIITRDLTMLIDIRGDVSAAQGSDGVDLYDATVGNSSTQSPSVSNKTSSSSKMRPILRTTVPSHVLSSPAMLTTENSHTLVPSHPTQAAEMRFTASKSHSQTILCLDNTNHVSKHMNLT